MKVLMLGWEFPPYITGGLGTACLGLTRAMHRRGMQVTFVLPKAAGSDATHVRLVSPDHVPEDFIAEGGFTAPPTGHAPGSPGAAVDPGTPGAPGPAAGDPGAAGMTAFEFIGVPSGLVHPYQRHVNEGPVGADALDLDSPDPSAALGPGAMSRLGSTHPGVAGLFADPPPPGSTAPAAAGAGGSVADYGHDLIGEVERYARFCLEACRGLKFDIIHAHDWMTYPAGLWIARATGRPLVVHVHSTEFDRSGEHVNQLVYDIERRGMHGALKVITVSQLTRNLVVARYGVPARQVEVVYNGVEFEPRKNGMTGIQSRDKIVLYFGRITFQKGPEYFIAAAKRVLEVMDDVKFVVAGSGDMARSMIEMAAAAGIGHKVLFTGFLRGDDIQRVFSLADLYVMPSVSEPFGIAPLEAMSHDVPALISRTSGVSEVLTHALKVDFWDIDDMANKIIAVLKYPPLSQTLREHGAFEVRRLTWDGAAERCEQVYGAVLRGMTVSGRGTGVVRSN